MNELDDLQKGRGAAGMNEYDQMLADESQMQKSALQQSMFVASRKDPAREAQVLELAQKSKLPKSVVDRNLDVIKQKAQNSSLDYDSLIEKTPGLAKWMEDPSNATLAKDDLDPLGRIDKSAAAIKKSRESSILDDLSRAGQTGFRGLESSAWHLAAAYGLSSPEEAAEQAAAANKRSQELRAQIPDYAQEFNKTMEEESGDLNRAFNKFTGSFETMREGKILQALKDFSVGHIQTAGEVIDMVAAAAVRPKGLMYSTVENLANSAPALVAGAGMAKAGAAAGTLTGPAAPVAVPALAVGGMAVGSFMGAVPVEVGAWINQEMQARGVDITDAQALSAAYRDTKMMADIRSEAERKGVTTAGVDALFNAFAGRLLKGAKPGIVSKTIAGAKEIGVQAVGEATSEFAGQVAAKGKLEGTNFAEAIQEGIISLGHSVGDVVVGTSVRKAFSQNPVKAAEEIATSTQNAIQSLHEAELMSEIGKAAKELKVAGNVPGKIQELVQSGAAPEAVFFQTDDWDKYWRSKGQSPAKAAEQLMNDGGKAYFEAKKTGADLEIPFSAYVDRTARTEDFEGLLPSAKTSPDGMTAQESREHLRNLSATMEDIAREVSEQMKPEGPTPEQSAAEVGKTVAEQLKEVGVDPDQAVLYEEGFRVLGERMGMDPKELFDQYRLRITGDLPAGEGATYNQPARSVTFPVKQSPEGIFSVSPGEGLNAAGRIVDGKMQIEGLYFDKKYQGVGQDMIRSLERTALGAGAYSMEAVATTEQQRSVLEAQGFELQSESGDGAVMFKDLSAARTYNQSVEMAPPMYSKLEQTIMQKMGGSQDVQSLRAMLKDIKPEEMKWSGLDEFLKGKEKVTKQEVLDHIRANQIQIVDVVNGGAAVESVHVYEVEGGDWFGIVKDNDGRSAFKTRQPSEAEAQAKVDAFLDSIGGKNSTKFSQYTLPGGENYREVLFTLPPKPVEEITELPEGYTVKEAKSSLKFGEDDSNESGGWFVRDPKGETVAVGLSEKQAVEKAINRLNGFAESREQYKSGHWDEANVLAHVRLNDRTDADGKRVLFVEEIQSDWHQAGRKKGYKGEQAFQIKDADGEVFTDKFKTKEEAQAFIDSADISDDVRKGLEIFEGPTTTGVPDAPFRKTWHEFAMKRIIRMAAEGGYDRVAWTTGEQQAERYDLSKQVDSVGAFKKDDGTFDIEVMKDGRIVQEQTGVAANQLDELLGKDLAEKIINEEGTQEKSGYRIYSGIDLKVGGEGMKGFYDKILVDFAKKFGKKFGAKVGRAEVPGDAALNENLSVIRNHHDDTYYIGKPSGSVYSDSSGGYYESYESREEAEGVLSTLTSGKTEVHALDITPELRDAALNEGFTLFQQDQDDIRGQIRIGPGGINISILKNANASTFIHETGHFYLEVLKDLASRPEAPQQIKDDWQTIRDWLGAKEGEPLTVDQHETFARGFEGYLMDGKAPTSKLAEAWSRFKVWLMSVYRRLRPSVEFSKEVRDVMGRLFATDEELRMAEGDYPALFADPAATGMNEAQAERYMKARADARLAAEEQLTRKVMEDFRKSEQAFYKERRVGVEKEVREELINTREYAALAILQSKLPSPEVFKISAKSIKDMGLKVSDLPPRVTAKDGLHVEQAALALGFRDGAELVERMRGLPSLNERVQQVTDQRMAEYYPDILTDPKLSDETIKSIHNEKRAELLEMELKHLAEMNPAVMKDVTRRIVRRPPTRQEVRREAQKILGTTKAGEIKPHLYQRAEVRAAKEAGQALAAGDLDAAFEAKQRELLAHELYRQAVDARELIDDSLRDFRKFKKSDEKVSKNRDMNLVDAGRAILAAFGIGQQGADAYMAQEILERLQKYDPDNYQVAKSLFEEATENGAGPWQGLPFDDFVAMKNSVDALWDLSKNVKQIEVDGKKMDLDQVKEELAAQAVKFIDPSKKKAYTETADWKDKWRSRFMSSRADLIRIEHWAEAMDVGGNREFTNYIVRPIMDATTKYRLEKNRVLKEYQAILKSHEAKISREPIVSDEFGHRFRNKAELLMAVLHTGNESNKRKLLVGRGWGTVDEMGEVDTRKWDQFVARMQREGVLTAADYEFAQKIWDLMESLKPDAQKAHKQMYGYYFKEITAEPVVTPFGTYRGGYIPAKVDVNESEDADIRAEREAFEKNNNSYQFPTTGRGFTKSRVEQYAAPLTLDMNLLGGHIDAVLRFTNIEPRVKEVSRIVTDKGFREVLRQIDPAVAKDALIPWLQRAAQQQVVMPAQTGLGRLTDAAASKLRTAVSMQVMFLNITNSMQQLTGITVAGVKVKPRYLRNALATYLTTKGVTEDVVAKSEWMRSTMGQNTYETAKAIKEIIVQPSTFESLQEFGVKHTYFLQSAIQNVVNTVVWIGAYNQALESGMTEAQAIKDADSAVRTTQGTVNPEDVSRFETGTATARLFKQFVGYFNMLANLNAFEIQKISRETGLKKGAGRAFYVYMMGIAIPAFVSDLIVRAMAGNDFDEDDDDFYLDDLFRSFFGSQFKTVAATVPYGGALAVSAYNRFNRQRYDDRLSLSPVLSILEGVAGTPYELYKNIAEDVDNEKRITKDALTLIGLMSTLPTGPIGKPVGYLMDVQSGRAEPTGPIDFARGLITGKPGQQQ